MYVTVDPIRDKGNILDMEIAVERFRNVDKSCEKVKRAAKTCK